MKRFIHTISGIGYILLITAFLASCGSKESDKGTEEATADSAVHQEDENSVEITQAQYKTIGLVLSAPEQKALSGLLKVNGIIEVPPQNLVSITTQMGGIVKSTPLLQGSLVRKGQVIAVLQNQEYVQLQQDYLESKSQLELASVEYQRQQTLSQQNVNSQKILQQAKSQYHSALARESALRQRLQMINISARSLSAGNIRGQINIYSPISGYVTKVNVNTGKYVNPNDVMFEIVNSSNLHVELNVFEKDAAKVKAGQNVRFTLANDSTERRAVVQLVGREINPDKTITVHSIAKGSFSFIPGTYVKAFIETGLNTVLALPANAVVDFEGKKYVFTSAAKAAETGHQHKEKESETEKESAGESYHFQMVEVTTGLSDGQFIEVQLPEGTEKVVTKGAYDLLSKLKNSEEEE